MTHNIKSAIQNRIARNKTHGVGFIEGQMLPHIQCLETVCTLAEFWAQGMNDEAQSLIQTLPQRETIQRIYDRCAGVSQ